MTNKKKEKKSIWKKLFKKKEESETVKEEEESLPISIVLEEPLKDVRPVFSAVPLEESFEGLEKTETEPGKRYEQAQSFSWNGDPEKAIEVVFKKHFLREVPTNWSVSLTDARGRVFTAASPDLSYCVEYANGILEKLC